MESALQRIVSLPIEEYAMILANNDNDKAQYLIDKTNEIADKYGNHDITDDIWKKTLMLNILYFDTKNSKSTS